MKVANDANLFVGVRGHVGGDKGDLEVGDKEVSGDALLAIGVWCKP